MGKLHLHVGLQILFTTPSHAQNFVTIHKFWFCNASERKLHLPSGMYSEIFSFLPLTQTAAEDSVHSAQNQALIFYTCPNPPNALFLTKNSHFHRFSRPFHALAPFRQGCHAHRRTPSLPVHAARWPQNRRAARRKRAKEREGTQIPRRTLSKAAARRRIPLPEAARFDKRRRRVYNKGQFCQI